MLRRDVPVVRGSVPRRVRVITIVPANLFSSPERPDKFQNID